MYAHARIELRHEDGSVSWIERGDEVDPSEVDGGDELVEAGSISDESYDESADVTGPPATVEIDGVTYIQSDDGASAGESTDA